MVSTHLKQYARHIGSFPQVGAKLKKYLEPPPRKTHIAPVFKNKLFFHSSDVWFPLQLLKTPGRRGTKNKSFPPCYWRIIPFSKYLGSPPFISHKNAIWKGSHNPRSWGQNRSPWLRSLLTSHGMILPHLDKIHMWNVQVRNEGGLPLDFWKKKQMVRQWHCHHR